MSIEREYERVHEVVDYGVDMEDMANIDAGEIRTMLILQIYIYLDLSMQIGMLILRN